MAQEQVTARQVQIKRSDKTLANLSDQKLKYGEPMLLTNADNRALVIGNSNENDALSNEYFIPIGTKDDISKGYMVKGVDYVTAGKLEGTSLGNSATAEGHNTTASANYSHAEGYQTIASGHSSHAEGYYTTASGEISHAEGAYTIANHDSQHVFGRYNVADTSSAPATDHGNYVEIVGNGTSNNARSNARTLDWSGNETLAGKLTVGAAPTANMDVATKKYVDDKVSPIPGTVTSVQVQATAPVRSSTSTAQTSILNTTISLQDSYGDTTVTGGKNPYAAKAKNTVLAGPGSGSNAAPTFRALVVADLPTVTIPKGGTGATTVEGARNALGLGNTAGALPIANGGTGAATAAAARTALGVGASGTHADDYYALKAHTHGLSIAADSGTNQLTLAASTKYKITAGGSSYVFTTPPNTTYDDGAGLTLSGNTFSLITPVPVRYGGTGKTLFNTGEVIMSHASSGQGEFTSRAVKDQTSPGTFSNASVKIPTERAVFYAFNNMLNRDNPVWSANTKYTVYMARAIVLSTTTPTTVLSGGLWGVYSSS